MYPVRTAVSRYLFKGVDCVLHIIPPVQEADPAVVQTMERLLPKLKLNPPHPLSKGKGDGSRFLDIKANQADGTAKTTPVPLFVKAKNTHAGYQLSFNRQETSGST